MGEEEIEEEKRELALSLGLEDGFPPEWPDLEGNPPEPVAPSHAVHRGRPDPGGILGQSFRASGLCDRVRQSRRHQWRGQCCSGRSLHTLFLHSHSIKLSWYMASFDHLGAPLCTNGPGPNFHAFSRPNGFWGVVVFAKKL